MESRRSAPRRTASATREGEPCETARSRRCSRASSQSVCAFDVMAIASFSLTHWERAGVRARNERIQSSSFRLRGWQRLELDPALTERRVLLVRGFGIHHRSERPQLAIDADLAAGGWRGQVLVDDDALLRRQRDPQRAKLRERPFHFVLLEIDGRPSLVRRLE